MNTEHTHEHKHQHEDARLSGCSCGCGHCHGEEEEEGSGLWQIIVGAIALIAFVAIQKISGSDTYAWPMIVGYVVVYLLLGGEILLTAGKNIVKGEVFDENFLMSIATLGALAMQEFPEAIGVMLFFRVGEFFEDMAVDRSRDQIMDAVDLRPEVVNKIVDGETYETAAKDVEVGDILMVRVGDRIPMDSVVVKGESRLDTSAVTGEPVPVKVAPGTLILSGCVNTAATLQIKVDKTLDESMVTKILNSVENASANKPHIDQFITRFAKIYTPIVVLIALFTAIAMPLITGQAFYPWIYTALSFLVMSCPCAVVISVPLAYFCGIGAASRQGILFKGGIIMEALARIRNVVMDKTGTITKGNFSLKNVVAAKENEDEVLHQAAMCEMDSTHPIAVSIVSAAKDKGWVLTRPDKVEEISGKGIRAIFQGSEYLCGNEKLMSDCHVDLSGYHDDQKGTQVIVAKDGIYQGYLVIADMVKEEAKEAIGRIRRQNIQTAMLTGDTLDNAKVVAEEAGVEQVYARLLPQDKLNKLQEIRETNGSVLFVGDGINDAPVLAGADVGAAMGSGADAAIEAADVVFMNSNMDAIPEALSISRKTARIAKQNVIVAIAIKVAVMILGVSGIYANMWLAVFADTGVAFLCILNSVRILRKNK